MIWFLIEYPVIASAVMYDRLGCRLASAERKTIVLDVMHLLIMDLAT